MARVPRLTMHRMALAGVSLLVVIWLPGVLARDIHGIRANLRLSAAERAEVRGPSARAGSNLALVHIAQANIPAGEPYAVVLGGRWRGRHLAAAREAGRSWTQFALAPRFEVGPGAAAWLLILDSTPAAAGFSRPLHAWHRGRDWLVQVR
jgi:hypothetical protein